MPIDGDTRDASTIRYRHLTESGTAKLTSNTGIAERVARECGVSAPEINEYGNIVNGHNVRVPYQWHAHWNHDKPLTMCDLLSGRPLLAHDSHEGEWLSTLIDRIAQWVSLKAPRAVELPEYIQEEEAR